MSTTASNAVPPLEIRISIVDRRVLGRIFMTRWISMLVIRLIIVLIGIRVLILIIHIVCTMTGRIGGSGGEVVFGDPNDMVWMV